MQLVNSTRNRLQYNYCFLLQMNQQCKVCGEPAAGFHFGAFTCEGCKVNLNNRLISKSFSLFLSTFKSITTLKIIDKKIIDYCKSSPSVLKFNHPQHLALWLRDKWLFGLKLWRSKYRHYLRNRYHHLYFFISLQYWDNYKRKHIN